MQSDSDGAVTLVISSRGVPLGEALADWELDQLIAVLKSFQAYSDELRRCGSPDRTNRLQCQDCGGALTVFSSRSGLYGHSSPYDAASCGPNPVPKGTAPVTADEQLDDKFSKFVADSENGASDAEN